MSVVFAHIHTTLVLEIQTDHMQHHMTTLWLLLILINI